MPGFYEALKGRFASLFSQATVQRGSDNEHQQALNSEMIENDRPFPHPSPDNAQAVDRKSFGERLGTDDRRARQRNAELAPPPPTLLARNRREDFNLSANKGRAGAAFEPTADHPSQDSVRTKETETEASERASRVEAFKQRLREERAAQRGRDKGRDIEHGD